MIRRITIILFGMLCLSCSGDSVVKSATRQAVAEPTRTTDLKKLPHITADKIVPGLKVGNLAIGDSKDEAIRKLGSYRFYEFDYPQLEVGCRESSLEWGDANPDNVRNGIRASMRSGKVFQIAVDSFLFSTMEGITSDAFVKDVLTFYPDAEAFLLLNSATRLSGQCDSAFLLDVPKGIAFEFYCDKRTDNKRRVNFIHIFPPNSDFRPTGCITTFQEWKRIEVASLLN